MNLKTLIGGAVAAAVCLTAGAASAQVRGARTIHEARSVYRNMYVTQDGDERCLLFRSRKGAGRESCKSMSKPDFLVFDYARLMLAGLYVDPDPKSILIIGLGGGTLPSALQKLVPGAKIDVVELDGEVEKIAERYFGFKKGGNTRVFIEDGRVFVKRMGRAKAQYDMIMLDAFESDYIPEHMLTQEFLREVKTILAPRGVLLANTWSNSGLYDHESTTYASVFGGFYNLKYANRIILARPGGMPAPAEIRANAKAWAPKFAPIGADSGFIIRLMRGLRDWDPKARILTDQYSPSNVLNAR